MENNTVNGPMACPQCGTALARTLLDCPSCHWLVHSGRLKELSREAGRAEQDSDATAALTLWRQALDLLPPGSRQHEAVSRKIVDLSTRINTSGAPARPAPKLAAKAGLLGAAAIFLLTKGKLLLLGLTKSSTLFTLLLSTGVYWTAWGWKFALGLVLSIYVHEMGHVAMLRRYGIKASAPMFIPGLGALVLLKQHPATPGEDARVGLAGPLWGFAAVAAAYAVSLILPWPSFAAIARVGAWINLFNLLPVWQLDGGRAFSALSRKERWAIAAVLAGAWYLVKDGILLLLLMMTVVRAMGECRVQKPDRAVFLEYALLAILLSGLCTIPVNLPQTP